MTTGKNKALTIHSFVGSDVSAFEYTEYAVYFCHSFSSKEGFPCDSAGEVTACNAVDLGLIPGLGRSPEEEKVYPLQYADLENSMECIINTVTITNNHRYIRHD